MEIDLSGFEEIKNHPNYMINKDGQIWSKTRTIKTKGGSTQKREGRFLKPQEDGKGYVDVNLDGKSYSVHRLVALQYIPNPKGLATVNHKNEVRNDNRVSNLEWMSQADNIAYSKAKTYRLLDPEGNDIVIFNLSKFARDNRLSDSHLLSVIQGNSRQHKGYTRSNSTEPLPLF